MIGWNSVLSNYPTPKFFYKIKSTGPRQIIIETPSTVTLTISDLAQMAGMDMGQLLADQLVKAAKVVEEQLDAELNKLENMDEDEMEALVLISSLI